MWFLSWGAEQRQPKSTSTYSPPMCQQMLGWHWWYVGNLSDDEHQQGDLRNEKLEHPQQMLPELFLLPTSFRDWCRIYVRGSFIFGRGVCFEHKLKTNDCFTKMILNMTDDREFLIILFDTYFLLLARIGTNSSSWRHIFPPVGKNWN